MRLHREGRVHGRGRQVLSRLISLLLAASLLGACAGTRREEASIFDRPASTERDTGSCRPWFVSPSRDWGEGSAKHSCWNRFWEVPAALIAVPLAIAIVASPILIPVFLLK